MSLLGTKGVYGLIAIYEISKGTSEHPVSIKCIADASGVSKNYLEQILRSLRMADIINSSKGREGGYYLTRPLSEVSYLELFGALEGDFCLSSVDVNPAYAMLFDEFESGFKELFDKPLSDFNKNANKYLNYTI